MSEATYTHLEVEAALCIWEALIDFHAKNNSPLTELVGLEFYWDQMGTAQVRDDAIRLAESLERVWIGLSSDEQELFAPFDWDFTPWFLDQVTWITSGPEIDVAATITAAHQESLVRHARNVVTRGLVIA